MNRGLQDFLDGWDANYRAACSKVGLFDRRLNRTLDYDQQQLFAKAFYHARGEFYRFLWYLGSKVPGEEYKEVVLSNIREEFGGERASHEELYVRFAQALNLDIVEEVLNPTCRFPYIHDFNQGHLEWILTHNWPSGWAAFSAYERLDNIDYENLYLLAESFGLPKEALLFFEAHRVVEHFEAASPLLERLWAESPNTVKDGFHFIAEHQLSLWRQLSYTVITGH